MPVTELAQYVLFQLSQGNNTDPVVKALTVEEITTVVKMQMRTLKLEGDIIPSDYLQLIQYFIKKDMYWKLATATAPMNKTELGDIKLDKQDRFDHYYGLIVQNEANFQLLLKNPELLPDDGSFSKKVKSLNTIIDKPYCRSAYLQSYAIPKIGAKVDKIDEDFIYLTLNLGKVVKEDYLKTTIYSSNTPIMDVYANTINSEAKTEFMDYDIHRDKFKILKSNVTHILIQITLKNGLSAYYELEVKNNVNS